MGRGRERARYHHGALRSALVEEATVQVRERGVDQVSLRQVAQAVGVSPSAAYQHFPDKAGLLAAVCDRSFEGLATRMRAGLDTVETQGDLGSVHRFGALGRAYVAFAAEESNLFRHMFSAAPWSHAGHAGGSGDEGDNSAGDAGDAGDADVPFGADDGGAEGLDGDGGDGAGPGAPVGDDAYNLMLGCLVDLDRRGLLRPGLGPANGLDELSWALVHGLAALVVDGKLATDSVDRVVGLLGRLVLSEEATHRLELRSVVAGPTG